MTGVETVAATRDRRLGASARAARSNYPVIAGLVVGMLLAGALFRLSGDVTEPVVAGGATQLPVGGGSGAGSSAASGSATGAATGGSGAATGAGGGGSASGGPGGGQGSEAAPGATGPGSAAGAALTASDIGVTETSLSVGIGLLDLGGIAAFAPLAGLSPEEQQSIYQVFVDDINQRGGVLGRRIEAHYESVDVTNGQAGLAACATWAETDQVFAVIDNTTLNGAGQQCVTIQHQRVLIASSQVYSSGATYQRAGGLLISESPDGTRMFAELAPALERVGMLQGRTYGLIVDQGDGEEMATQGLIPALRSRGVELAYTAVVSQDPSQGPVQTSAQVAQMRSAGVDTVIDATTFVNMQAFVTQAERTGWRPTYVVNDWDGNAVGTFFVGMPESWNGAVLFTFVGRFGRPGESEQVRACRERYNAITGQSVPPDGDGVLTIVRACNYLDLFVRAATDAGPQLTRSGFSAAVQGLGSFPLATLWGGSFGPGKTDWGDLVAQATWGPNDGRSSGAACVPDESRCWNIVTDPFDPTP